MTEQNGTLTAMFKDWQQAQLRRQMAENTLVGARTDELAKEARFKGAAELLHGKDATFKYNEAGGLKFILPKAKRG